MTYAQRHKAQEQFLLERFYAKDWHGVSDAANELRVLEAQYAFSSRPSKKPTAYKPRRTV